jgi:hypothetical protein
MVPGPPFPSTISTGWITGITFGTISSASFARALYSLGGAIVETKSSSKAKTPMMYIKITKKDQYARRK